MNIVNTVIVGLAIWRISSLFVKEDGPFRIFRAIREKSGLMHSKSGEIIDVPPSFFAQVLSCVWCFSLYVSLPFGVSLYFQEETTVLISLPFALSAATIVINLIVEKMKSW